MTMDPRRARVLRIPGGRINSASPHKMRAQHPRVRQTSHGVPIDQTKARKLSCAGRIGSAIRIEVAGRPVGASTTGPFWHLMARSVSDLIPAMARQKATQTAHVRQANAGVLIARGKTREKAPVPRLSKAASRALAKCRPGASMICHHTILVRALTDFTEAMAQLLMAMPALRVSQAGPGTAIKPQAASRESRGIRISKPVSARAAARKDGASRSCPRRPPTFEDLSEIGKVTVAHRIRMQARHVRTAGRGVPIEPPEHRKVRGLPCNRNLPPIGAVKRQAGVASRARPRRPFMPHQA
ncbi:hypothetical protein [Bradyrhizobium elkanii]|uniref:Uncharacterized protein n=1 Tax=Bradyrhizobium elkanii TaxID=29448 RepID=A0A8I1YP31_BRAEL|nr:hypothetical protein [Bradyrhizobium elkanii]MBP1299733.1 hypothetical protein [Bradyrhizobium elkanii]MCP1972026.1 hypothetical protein [Bradyrhizobium elkanii]MCS3519192.1 hypothetical protein [Bradyrhizobium elkanii]MCS4066851.1 hypothetical protein [Bradyrhizobium elkanii]MCS4082382.1 hypothetical protein [Bradyrhizobium elkanii]